MTRPRQDFFWRATFADGVQLPRGGRSDYPAALGRENAGNPTGKLGDYPASGVVKSGVEVGSIRGQNGGKAG
jgi:hypothetical protein